MDAKITPITISMADAARIYCNGKWQALRRAARRGELPYKKFGRDYMVKVSDVEKLVLP
jgi:hypothetical protein